MTNNGQPISFDEADRVWSLLIEQAGASPHPVARDSFLSYATGRSYVQEFRFCGKLAFGGKVRKMDGRWSVYCYPEDATAGRVELMKVINEELSRIQPQQSNEG